MTQEDLMRIKAEMEAAEGDTTPFIATNGNDIAVAGDPNKTEKKPYNYKITFVMPQTLDGKITYKEQEIEFNNVFITPRQNPRIVTIMTKIMPYFKKVLPDGTVGQYTDDEALEIITNWDDEILDLMYKLVGSVLGVDKSLWDNMRLDSVLEAFIQIVHNVPEVVNESDTSFQGNRSPIIRG